MKKKRFHLINKNNKYLYMNKILMWSVTAALAGFLFGFDVVVISGADKNCRRFGRVQTHSTVR
jgi:hypothetical protein